MSMKPYQKIIKYCHDHNIPYKANDNISVALEALNIKKEKLIAEVERSFQRVLTNLVIDTENDHNSKETAHRYAKMLINETFAGRYDAQPKITVFPNVKRISQLIVVDNIRIESVCAHHHQNIRGVCHIAILPDEEGSVMGLSKYSRIASWIARRPQIQEELTVEIANTLNHILQPRGVAVVVNADHQCMLCRGVMEPNAKTTTSHLIGEFLNNPTLRQEFYNILQLRR